MPKKIIHIIVSPLVVVGVLCCSMPARAEDDVLTAVEEAVRQYKSGDYMGAVSNLDYASQLIRQKRSEKMRELLPEALPGWQAEPADNRAVGVAVLGGVVTVSRDYHKAASVISVEIISDSPMMQSVIMMLNNPIFAGAGGGELETIKGQRAIVKFDAANGTGEAHVVVADKFMVIVKGRRVKRSDLVDYCAAIDFQALAGK